MPPAPDADSVPSASPERGSAGDVSGAPRKAPRSRPFVLRLSDSEHLAVEQQAGRLGLQEAAYIRARVCGYKVPSPRRAISREDHLELGRLVTRMRLAGDKLNALAHTLNMALPVSVDEARLGMASLSEAADLITSHLTVMARGFTAGNLGDEEDAAELPGDPGTALPTNPNGTRRRGGSRGLRLGPRRHKFVFRLSTSEHAKIEHHARQLHLEKTAYIRARIFDYKVPSIRGAVDDQVYRELSLFAVDMRNAAGNITQLSEALNLTRTVDVPRFRQGLMALRLAVDSVRLHLIKIAEDLEDDADAQGAVLDEIWGEE